MFKTDFIDLKEVNSTISYAKEYLKEKNYLLEQNIVITAETQTNGVGKFNRKWVSPKGNLYLTAIFKPFKEYSWNNFNNINIFNLLVSLSLLQSINYVLKGEKYNIFCKWPNDIIINKAKVSGILLEKLSKNGIDILLISLGTNLTVSPEVNSNYKTISLKDINNTNISYKDFSIILLNTIYSNIKNLTKKQVKETWLQHAYKLNEVIQLKYSNINKTGIFRGLNADGLLLLETSKGVLDTISIGEIY